ncbi:MAG: D-glycero-beta-D-manno-heptose 1-phosphate adenylyltransferase [Deltaproteobacteria bacterium]|nr:D-glycero-beta-D-manno-heptose 1-phosphate adenylyltransferase [Deltaproteobacteria bacterium]MBW2098775.1 D-glycero-beta-D-manno-heptose 1-phosphate adenylyltransferase [Deltaproteobacteria bacterium]
MRHSESTFKMGIFQFTPKGKDIHANWKKVESATNETAGAGAELLLLPELWATGPLGEADRYLAHEIPELLPELKTLAEKNGIHVVGTLPELAADESGEKLFNTTYVIGPDNIFHTYRKIHLFAPMGEDHVFSPGTDPVALWIPFKRSELGLGLITCFDLRFPEIVRHLVYLGVDLVLLSALWPLSRRRHLELLMESRAVESQCFLAGANAWGMLGDTEFGGGSEIIGPRGEILAKASDRETILLAELDMDEIHSVRQDFFTAHAPRSWWPKANTKILDLPSLSAAVNRRRKAGQKMVFTNGCFDILHAGHVSYLESARHMGDYLVVGLNSDKSVRKIKGPGRPVNHEAMRAHVLAGLAAVDYVVIFDDPTPLHLIQTIIPNILVKGADWKEKDIVGAETVKNAGGRIARIPFVYDTSTSRILKLP